MIPTSSAGRSESGPEPTAVYLRVSTKDQAAHGYSLDETQPEKIAEHCDRWGWTIGKTYREIGSGGNDNRPEYRRLLADGRDGQFKRVVVFKLSRFGRTAIEILRAVEELKDAGVEIVSISEHFDTSTPAGKLQLTMLAAIAEYERENTAENVRLNSFTRVRSGKYHGPKLTGYDVANDTLTPNADADMIRAVFRHWLAGLNKKQVADRLRADGYRTVADGTQIRKWLINRHYIGEVKINDHWFPGAHEPLVSREDFDRAQTLMPGRRTGPPVTLDWLCDQGLLRCAHGHSMTGRRDHDRTRTRVYDKYHCVQNRRYKSGTCPQEPIPRAAVDTAILDYFARVALDTDATVENLRRVVHNRAAETRSMRERAEMDVARATAALHKIEDQLGAEAITVERFNRMADRFESEITAAQAELVQIAGREAELADDTDVVDAHGEFVARMTALRATVAGHINGAGDDIKAVRAALRETFESFTVTEAGLVPKLHAERIAYWVDQCVSESGSVEPIPRPQPVDLPMSSGGTPTSDLSESVFGIVAWTEAWDAVTEEVGVDAATP